MKQKFIVFMAVLGVSVSGYLLLNFGTIFAATTIVVNSTADDQDNDGECTLREAIVASNTDTASGAAAGECEAGSGSDTINFAITGTADFTNDGEDGYSIEPSSVLPTITDTVTINGYSQANSSENTSVAPNALNTILLIEINGTSAGNVSGIITGAGSANSVIKGLIVNNFEVDGVLIGDDDVSVQGNFVGSDHTGLVDEGNLSGGIEQNGDDSDGALIGGLDPEDRNLISGNEDCGVSPNTDSDNWVVQGNYIGVDKTGLTAMPNGTAGPGCGGMSLDYSDGHIIGGTETGATNVISGNDNGGIQPDDVHGAIIQGNYIGLGADGVTAVPNGTNGIAFGLGSSNNLVGGTSDSAKNYIVSNGENGVTNQNDATTNDNTIIGNVIVNNTDLGIDNGYDGADTNDALDVDTGPNDHLNHPVIAYSQELSGNTTVDYSIDVPSGDYRIELFSDSGETLLGTQNINSAGSGEENFYITVSGTGYSDLAITATEIDASSDGFGATSEFGSLNTNSDISVSVQVVDNDEPYDSDSIQYRATIVNRGPKSVDLSDYDGTLGNPAIGGLSMLLPPETTLVSDDSADITCSFFAPASATGPVFGNHSTYNIIACPWTGSSQILQSGESYSVILTASVDNPTPATFKAFVFMLAEPNDPDYPAISVAIPSGNDIVDEFIAGSVNNYNEVTWPMSGSEDSDGDGVLDVVENASPNSGDGNGDSVLDSVQPNVTSILDATSNNHLTLALETGGDCNEIGSFEATTEGDQAKADTNYNYPLGLNSFTIPCSYVVNGSVYYHGLSSLADYTYRKFGPTTPGDSNTTAWYNSGFTYSTETINSKTVAKANFSLRDGLSGDDTGDDNSIVDDNGPGVVVSSSLGENSLANTGQSQTNFVFITIIAVITGSALLIRTKLINN